MLVIEGPARRWAPKPAVDDVSREIGAGGFIGVIGRSTGSRRRPRGASASAESMSPACRAASRRARCDDIPTVQSGWQARRADPRPVGPPQPHADLARGTPALVGQGVHVFRARAVDIASLAAQRADNLSGGQQQRVAIARALVQGPEIILADEPVASLDPRNARVVMDALQRINRHHDITVLCNLHSLDLARGHCDHLIGMANGRVVFDGATGELTDAASRQLYGIEVHEAFSGELATPEGATAAVA